MMIYSETTIYWDLIILGKQNHSNSVFLFLITFHICQCLISNLYAGMTTIGLKPSLYLLKLVEANIAHEISINANKCQKEPITNPKTIALDRVGHGTLLGSNKIPIPILALYIFSIKYQYQF